MNRTKELEALSYRLRQLAEKSVLTGDEKTELDAGMQKGRELRDAIHRDASIDEFTKTISSDVAPQTHPSNDVVLGRSADGFYAMADRAQFEKAAEGMKSKGQWGFDMKYRTKADVDNATAEVNFEATTGTPAGAQYGTAVNPFYYPGIVEPATRQPRIADLFAQGSTDSNLVRLVKETVTVDGSSASAEGAAYGASEIQVRPHDWPVRDITTLLPVTEDVLSDIPAMASYLSMRLAKFVQMQEETELLFGNGTGSHLEGIFELEGLTWNGQGSDTISEGVVRLIADVFNESFMDPEWCVMSPRTWAEYVLEREDLNGGAGAYLAGPVTQNPARSIWGLPIVVSPVVTNDKILVGNSAAGMIFRNGGLRVESSTGYGNFFGEGLVAIRAKVRTAFAVFRPAAIGVLNLGS